MAPPVDYETHRPTWNSGTVDFRSSGGFTLGEHVAHALRLKVLPVSLALPWGLDVGDLLGHLVGKPPIPGHRLRDVPFRARPGDA